MKKISIWTAVLILFISTLIFLNSTGGIKIYIKNNTSEDISELNILYSNQQESIKVPSISKGKQYKLKIATPKNSSEGYLKMNYMNNKEMKKEVVLCGYVDGAYSGKINIQIDSLDSEGNLEVKVNTEVGP